MKTVEFKTVTLPAIKSLQRGRFAHGTTNDGPFFKPAFENVRKPDPPRGVTARITEGLPYTELER